ncbi:MAG TPA: DUF1576 domain-containing protein [Magnetospirillaceae bacterium]|nr:DUF1576 domain-containing protein [Magnetospirillaceae bacterium]
MTESEKSLYRLMLVLIAGTAFAGLASPGPAEAVRGFLALQWVPSRLIHDYSVTGGPGGALLNAALVAALSLLLVRVNGVRLSGPTLAGVFTVMGFSLFGKTALNVLPVIAGVFLAARAAGKPFKSYIMIALFGTALGPLAPALALEVGLTGATAAAVGAAGGLAAGFWLPGLALAMLRLHEGYNLYNVGLTCGFFSLFMAAILSATNRGLAITVVWNETPDLAMILLVPAISVLLAAAGLAMEGKGAAVGLLKLVKLTGRLPSDFVDSVSPGAALLNMGILGLIGSAYVALVGGDFNGPVLGGLLTVIGFGAFGKHPRNSLPVMAGILAATLLSGKPLDSPGPILAILFGTTLAPLAGEFGPVAGFAAGFLHLTMVERTGPFQMGLNLYNNGFAGGLTAGLMAAFLEWIRSNRKERAK